MAFIPPTLRVTRKSMIGENEHIHKLGAELTPELYDKFNKVKGAAKNNEAVQAIIKDWVKNLSRSDKEGYWKLYKEMHTEAGSDISTFDYFLKNI